MLELTSAAGRLVVTDDLEPRGRVTPTGIVFVLGTGITWNQLPHRPARLLGAVRSAGGVAGREVQDRIGLVGLPGRQAGE